MPFSIDKKIYFDPTYRQSRMRFTSKKSIWDDHNDNNNRSMCAAFIGDLIFDGKEQVQKERRSSRKEPETMEAQ